jgi:hypothetical protein
MPCRASWPGRVRASDSPRRREGCHTAAALGGRTASCGHITGHHRNRQAAAGRDLAESRAGPRRVPPVPAIQRAVATRPRHRTRDAFARANHCLPLPCLPGRTGNAQMQTRRAAPPGSECCLRRRVRPSLGCLASLWRVRRARSFRPVPSPPRERARLASRTRACGGVAASPSRACAPLAGDHPLAPVLGFVVVSASVVTAVRGRSGRGFFGRQQRQCGLRLSSQALDEFRVLAAGAAISGDFR